MRGGVDTMASSISFRISVGIQTKNMIEEGEGRREGEAERVGKEVRGGRGR